MTSAIGKKRTFLAVRLMSAIGGKADMAEDGAQCKLLTQNGHQTSISCCGSEGDFNPSKIPI